MKSEMNQRDLPRYIQLEDLVLIGVNHTHTPQGTKKSTFIDEIAPADHLILEGNSIIYDEREQSYEELALRICNSKQVHYLEDNTDFFSLCNKYGMRKDLIGLYNALGDYGEAVKISDGDTDRFISFWDYLIDNIKQYYPGFSVIDKESVMNQIIHLTHNFARYAGEINMVGTSFSRYLAAIRNHELFGQRAQEYRKNLPGKKVLIAGDGHIDYVEKYLQGENVPLPLQWDKFMQTLDLPVQYLVTMIEHQLFPRGE